MAQNWLRITHQNDKIRLSWQRGYESPRFAPEVAFQQPFDEENAAELRWYLEDYLKFPYGIFPDNAVKIEQKLQHWGQHLFELVFRSTEKGREFFQEATREGLDNCELGIISDNAEVLNLPWELLYSPDYQFLAPSLAGMYRSLSSQGVKAPLPKMPDDQLNILLVIARPDDEQDVGFKTIARPLLAALQPIRQRVNLKVLRPPSLKAFEAELQANKGFYHIVHFDGHGNFDSETQGVLVFEDEQGNEQAVSAREIAQYLTDCRVPIFVLNACKSGQVGEEAFSSVAGQLVKLGAKGVVAMAYSVYAKGAEHFIGRLYGELVRGECIATAVAAGRKSMSIDKMRPSPKGNLPLQDWLVPVLYQQEPYTPFVPKKTVPSFADLMAQTDNTSESSKAVGLPDESAYGFIGRDYEILRLERAFRQNHLVLVQGMGGVGKTELAAGFARWLDDTQGRTGGMFFTSFEQGAGLSQVINQIGRALGGERFSQMMPDKQEDVVRQYLQTHPCLLIWDNFEPVNGFPTGNEPLLSGEERNKLKQFLKELRGGKSWVLITSRREEPWLDCGYSLINLRGLSQTDAQELAAKILQTVGVERKNLAAEYLELLKLLGGHPLSLRVVLPHLKMQTPVQLIEALRRGLDTFKGQEEEGREKSLTVSLDYSFAKLSERTRRHLPFLGLFCDRVDAHWLYQFSQSPDNEFGQAYQAVFGENLQKPDWIRILNEAAAAGILQYLGETIHKVHPLLPWYLRQQLNTMASQEAINELEKKLLIFYANLATHYEKELISNAELANFVLQVEEPNLLQNLRLSEQQQKWAYAESILRALANVYERLGRKPEFKSVRQRALNQIGIHLADAKAKGQDALDFWMYLRSVDAKEAAENFDLEEARKIYQEILDELIAVNDSSVNGKIATINQNFGCLTQKQRQFDMAVDYHHKALEIFKDTGNSYNAAGAYHQLGRIAQEQRQFDVAVDYYNKALKVFEDAGDLYMAAHDYQQLGVVAQGQRQFDVAVDYYKKALKIFEDAEDLYSAASSYHNLGVVAQQQRQFDVAVDYYKKALKIKEDVGDLYSAARDYHNLGVIAQEQRQFDVAVDYYKKALKIFEDAGDLYTAASNYHQLGMVAQEQMQFDVAVDYYKKALKIKEDVGDLYSAADHYHQLGRIAQEQRQFDVAVDYYNKALNIFEDARDLYSAADDYHLLGRVAQEQMQFDVAINYYQKAWGVFEQFCDWLKASVTLSQWGKVLEAQENYAEALQIYIRGLAIGLQHIQDSIGYYINDLGRMLQQLGESQFQVIWHEATGEECAGELREAIWAARDELV
ncbi:MAG: tetratricopeptide repeat protein [Nostoc sp. DedVER02]|uniref:tetratricopeptide repeat protein n=1 Tax=unclassified Nostoc TaxID=2593658 RepID=UPI002AD27306|nr:MULTISPECIES: tetratricopeptide repeat protein [unclassified Nostoc]MDZ7989244.1 tetratricopeptide repeat protein [Nostoc sp. DedVER02]MDZ8114324.1 tetratricopeptide repeat protein [Nostoc sp. DedVER01b]